MAARPKAKAPEYTHLTIRVEDYDVRCSAATNHRLYDSMRYGIDETEPVHTFETSVVLRGICTDPESRASAPYEITLIGASSSETERQMKVKDLHERDEDDMPRYRIHRGVSLPVYAEPPSLGFLDKVHGERRWNLWMRVMPQMVSDCLLLLTGNKPLYIAINEKKVGRMRHVQSLAIQSTDPDAE